MSLVVGAGAAQFEAMRTLGIHDCVSGPASIQGLVIIILVHHDRLQVRPGSDVDDLWITC